MRLSAIQQDIWATLIRAFHQEKSLPLAQSILPPTNEIFDLSTTRLLAARQHPPLAVFAMLTTLILMSATLTDYNMSKSNRRSNLHQVGFAAITSLLVYLILDIKYPRLGWITVESFDQAMIDLRNSMD